MMMRGLWWVLLSLLCAVLTAVVLVDGETSISDVSWGTSSSSSYSESSSSSSSSSSVATNASAGSSGSYANVSTDAPATPAPRPPQLNMSKFEFFVLVLFVLVAYAICILVASGAANGQRVEIAVPAGMGAAVQGVVRSAAGKAKSVITGTDEERAKMSLSFDDEFEDPPGGSNNPSPGIRH